MSTVRVAPCESKLSRFGSADKGEAQSSTAQMFSPVAGLLTLPSGA
jgi:hypothetical protein